MRQLSSYINRHMKPELVVFLVDGDGDAAERRRRLIVALENVNTPAMPFVVEPEFEALLLADEVAASRVLGRTVATAPAPDKLKPGAAKALLNEWTGAADQGGRALRMALAEECDLEVVRRRVASMDTFLEALRGG